MSSCVITSRYRPAHNFQSNGCSETFCMCETHGVELKYYPPNGECSIGALETKLVNMIQQLEEKIDNL